VPRGAIIGFDPVEDRRRHTVSGRRHRGRSPPTTSLASARTSTHDALAIDPAQIAGQSPWNRSP
jgi:hypothetical protein